MMSYIVVIGSANIDISLNIDNDIIWRDSNIGLITLSPGGVGRNIAENLGRINLNTHFITPLGHEMDAKLLKDSCTENGVVLHPISNDAITTSKYAALFDKDNDMLVGVADTLCVEALQPKEFKPYRSLIEKAALLVLETNLSESTLKYLSTLNKRVFINAISTSKAPKIKSIYPLIDTLSLNRLEAKTLTNFDITETSIEKTRDFFIDLGVQTVIITLGSEGAYVLTKEKIIKKAALKTNVESTSGAGDGFFAGYIYGLMKGKDPLNTANALASITLQSKSTVNPTLDESKLKTKLKESKHA
jgi:pseudouridine kinase